MRIIKLKNRWALLACAITSSMCALYPATFTVTKTTDSGAAGELRWAIRQSNRTKGANTINFNIPGSGPFTITPLKDLDAITNPVTINGYSQSGASANTLATGNNAVLQIVISGNNYATGNATSGTGNGLTFTSGSGGSLVKGLVINAWINTGILIANANSISICGCFIGTNALGNAQLANQCGIFIASCNSPIIGTPNPADRNVITGSFFFFNESAGLVLDQTNNAIVQNCFFGTDKTGSIALGNSIAGIQCLLANETIIGSANPTGRNIFSGHTIFGVSIEDSSYVQVIGNYIVGNLNEGITITGSGATNNTISSNVISANYIGIKLGSRSSLGANLNTIKNNLIGTDSTGLHALGNSYGIVVNDNSNTIGGTSIQTHNIISGNIIYGVLVYGGASSNMISWNYIGINSAGSPLPNGYGIKLGLIGPHGAAGSNTIQNNQFGGGNSVITTL